MTWKMEGRNAFGREACRGWKLGDAAVGRRSMLPGLVGRSRQAWGCTLTDAAAHATGKVPVK